MLSALLLVVGLVVAHPLPAASQQGSERHSGSVVSVNLPARTLVVQELVADGRPRRLEVRVPEGAPVVYSERVPDEKVTSLESPFDDRRIDLREVRPGDFVVLEGAARDGKATASVLVVTLRGGAVSASPGGTTRP